MYRIYWFTGISLYHCKIFLILIYIYTLIIWHITEFFFAQLTY